MPPRCLASAPALSSSSSVPGPLPNSATSSLSNRPSLVAARDFLASTAWPTSVSSCGQADTSISSIFPVGTAPSINETPTVCGGVLACASLTPPSPSVPAGPPRRLLVRPPLKPRLTEPGLSCNKLPEPRLLGPRLPEPGPSGLPEPRLPGPGSPEPRLPGPGLPEPRLPEPHLLASGSLTCLESSHPCEAVPTPSQPGSLERTPRGHLPGPGLRPDTIVCPLSASSCSPRGVCRLHLSILAQMDGLVYSLLGVRLERDVFAPSRQESYCSNWGCPPFTSWSTFIGIYYPAAKDIDTLVATAITHQCCGLFVVPVWPAQGPAPDCTWQEQAVHYPVVASPSKACFTDVHHQQAVLRG